MAATRSSPWALIVPIALLVLAPQLLLVVPGLQGPRIAENRALAPVPTPPSAVGDLDRFRKEVDAWISDHFPARTLAISGLNLARYRLGYSGTGRVRVGAQGWLFYDGGDHFRQLRATTLEAAEIASWVDELRRREAELRDRGTRYYVLVPPLKERVHPDRLPAWLQRPPGPADADVLADAARAAGIDLVLSPLQPLRDAAARDVDVYTPFDTHWTGRGAHEGYRMLLEAMRADGVAVAARPPSAFAVREPAPALRDQDLAHMLGIAGFVDQRFAYLEDPRVQAALTVTPLEGSTRWSAARAIDTGQPGPVLLFLGDSFSNALLPLLLPHFSRVVFAHHDDGFHREDLIERFRPDVVVLQVLESGVRHAMPTRPGATPRFDAQALVPSTPPAPDDADAPAGVTYQCSLDQWRVVADGVTRASGWFADVAGRAVPDAVDVMLQGETGTWRVSAATGGDRPDVATHFGIDALARSGFDVHVDTSVLPSGRYVVHLQGSTPRGLLRCRLPGTLDVPSGLRR